LKPSEAVPEDVGGKREEKTESQWGGLCKTWPAGSAN